MNRRTFGQMVAALLVALGFHTVEAREPALDECPGCGKKWHYCCSDRECQCWQKWSASQPPLARVSDDEDVLSCPNCGYAAHIDFWFDRDLQRVNDDLSMAMKARKGDEEVVFERPFDHVWPIARRFTSAVRK